MKPAQASLVTLIFNDLGLHDNAVRKEIRTKGRKEERNKKKKVRKKESSLSHPYNIA